MIEGPPVIFEVNWSQPVRFSYGGRCGSEGLREQAPTIKRTKYDDGGDSTSKIVVDRGLITPL